MNDFPFKFRATAFLLSKGLRNAKEAVDLFLNECIGLRDLSDEDFKLFNWIYTESDFYKHQSIIESLVMKIQKPAFSDRSDLHKLAATALTLPPEMGAIVVTNVWGRLNQTWMSLTDKQRQLLEILYTSDAPMTYEEAAAHLEISVDSVRDREDGAILKFRKEFPEFKNLHPYKDWTKNQIRPYIYRGLMHTPSMEIAQSCYRIRTVDGKEVKEWVGGNEDPFLRHDEFSFKDWLRAFRDRLRKKAGTVVEIDAG